GFVFVESMMSVAPNRLASSSRFVWMSMRTILEAPAMRAPLTALSPTPPAPKITTVSPAQTFAVFKTEPAPVTTPQPRSAAWANGSSLGTKASWFSWMSVCAAKPPSPKPWNKPIPLRLRRGALVGLRTVDSGYLPWKDPPQQHQPADPL